MSLLVKKQGAVVSKIFARNAGLNETQFFYRRVECSGVRLEDER